MGGCLRGVPFIHSVVMWIMAGIRLGDALLRSPQLERTCLSLSHISSPFWHWNMCETSSMGCTHSLGHY